MTNSILLENITRDDLRCMVSECVQDALSKNRPSPPQTDQGIEQPISQPEAIKFLGKSRQTLISWRRKGIIHAHTLGGRVYYMRSELLDALRAQ
jgi:hypothetical protein